MNRYNMIEIVETVNNIFLIIIKVSLKIVQWDYALKSVSICTAGIEFNTISEQHNLEVRQFNKATNDNWKTCHGNFLLL